MTITTMCPMCRSIAKITVKGYDYDAFLNGVNISECFPYLSAEDRERLLTGICPDCWDNMFPLPEEDDDIDIEDDVDETGFNPYIGCYDYDC